MVDIWDNHKQHEAPPPSPDYERAIRRERIRVLVKLLLAAAILVFGILWHHGWRPF